MKLTRRDDIEVALELWAKEYGGSKYENVGFPRDNLLHRMLQGSGGGQSTRSVIRTRGDDVEVIYRGMIQGKLYREGMVLQCDYFHPRMAMSERIEMLRRVGVAVNKNTYPEFLMVAKLHVEVELVALRKAA